MTEEDITLEVLRTVNRPEDDDYWKDPVSKFVSESINRLLIKIDFEIFNDIISVNAVNDSSDKTSDLDLNNTFKRIELVLGKGGQQWRLIPFTSMIADVYLKSPKCLPAYTLAKRGNVIILPPRFNEELSIQGYRNLTGSRAVDDKYTNEFLPAVHDYVYYDALDRMYMFLQEDENIIAANRQSRDSAFLDVETWSSGFKQVGIIQIFG